MTKDKLFHKHYARELVSIARGDLDSAEVLQSQPNKGRPENICFNAQQAIEKVLKAVLCAMGRPVPLTHSIELLLDRLGADQQPPHGESLIVLTDFATIKRYQEGDEILTKEDFASTIEAARKTITWADELVESLLK